MNVVMVPAFWNVTAMASNVVELPGSTKCHPQPSAGQSPASNPGLVAPE